MARRRPRGWHRQVRRKFVWDRTRASPPVPMLMVLISWPTSEVSLAQRIWAQLSLDSWVRLAGCSRWGGSLPTPISPVPSASASTHGMKIHSMSTTTRSRSRTRTGWAGCPTSTTVLSVQTCGRRLPETHRPLLRRRHQGTEEAGRAEPDSLDVLHSRGRCHHVQLGPQYRSEAALTRLTA